MISLWKNGGVFEISNSSEVIEADQCISSLPVQHLVAALDNVPAVVNVAVYAINNVQYNLLFFTRCLL